MGVGTVGDGQASAVGVGGALVAETEGWGVSDGGGRVTVGEGVTSTTGIPVGSIRLICCSAPASQKLPRRSPPAAKARTNPPNS